MEKSKEITYPNWIYGINVALMIGVSILLSFYVVFPIYTGGEEGLFGMVLLAVALVAVAFIVHFAVSLFTGEFREKKAKKHISIMIERNKLMERRRYVPMWKYYRAVSITSVVFVAILSILVPLVGTLSGGLAVGGIALAIPTLFIAYIAFSFFKELFNGEFYKRYSKNYIKSEREKESKKAKKEDVETEVKEYKAPDLIEDEMIMLNNEKLAELGSYPNPKDQRDGYQWSSSKDVFKAGQNKKVYLDNFALSGDVLDGLAEKMEDEDDIKMISNVESKIDPLSLTRTLLMIGSMGSGKTFTINSLIAQGFQNRTLISDVKGDFVEKFYRPEKDIILNLFDCRGKIWSLFDEMRHNPEVVQAFVKNLVKSSVGDKGEADFFSNQASKIISENFLQVAFTDLSNLEKWERLITRLEQYLNDADKGGDKTKSSIALTMDLSMEIFKMIAYRIRNGAELFTITDFFNRKDGQKLFLLSNPAFSNKLTPYFTGFLGAFTDIALGRADTKTDFTLTVLDEFYSLNFDKSTKTSLLTMSRSKGLQLVLATQYLDARKDRQLLESSRYAMMVFTLADGDTVKRVGEMMGKMEYKEDIVSVNRDWGHGDVKGGKYGSIASTMGSGKKYSRSAQVRDKQLLSVQKLQSMPAYHHVTIIPSENLVYLGITKFKDLEVSNSNFEAIDMERYYKYLYADLHEDSPVVSTLTEADLLDGVTEEELFVHWLRLKFPEDDVALDNYIKKYGFTEAHIAKIFSEFDEDKEVIKEAREKYGNEEIVTMMDEFFALDDKEKYRYCKNKKIIGAIIGLFILDGDFIIDKMERLV